MAHGGEKMQGTAEVFMHADRHAHIEGSIVLPPGCEYPTCADTSLNGIVVKFINGKQLEHRAYCCELHTAFALLELAQRDLSGAGDGEGTASECITKMVARSLAGEPMTDKCQDDIDGEVDGSRAAPFFTAHPQTCRGPELGKCNCVSISSKPSALAVRAMS
jgi:hypothetical protein